MNKVNPDKMEMVQDYFSRALKRWDVELIGCIPELKALSHPSIADFSKLFDNAEIVSGQSGLNLRLLKSVRKSDVQHLNLGYEQRLRYFENIRLVVAPVDARNIFKPIPNQLVITVSLIHG